MTDFLNLLPAPTWEHMHVNRAPAAAALPEVPAAGFGPALTELSLPEGLAPLAAPLSVGPSGAGEALDAFVQKHANFSRFLTINGQFLSPMIIQYTLNQEFPAAISHLKLHAAPHSSLTVIEVFRGDAPGGIAAGLTEIQADEGASVTLFQLSLIGGNPCRYSGLAADLGPGASVRLYRAELGGRLSLCGSRAALAGADSAYEARTVYLGAGDATLDYSDTAIHLSKNTRSELHAAGALSGACKKVLRGTIDFRRGAVHGVGHESEDVLLLSPQVVNRTAPLILCGEELVEGQHAATAGRLDESILYYMAARGISEAEAKRLMVSAKFTPVLDQIPLENLKCEISDLIERRLGDAESDV